MGKGFHADRKRPAEKPSRLVVADLPRLLEDYRERCQREGKARMFNLARHAAPAFLRRADRALWERVRAIEPLPVAPVIRHPQTVAQALAIRAQLGYPIGEYWWGMCTTGMGPGEYWGRWEVAEDRVLIHGTKRAARERAIPLVEPLIVPRERCMPRSVATALARHGVKAYDARRSYATWLEEAGIPRTRRKVYLGHGPADVTDLCERHEVTAFRAVDGERLRSLLSVPDNVPDVTMALGDGASGVSAASVPTLSPSAPPRNRT